MNKKEVKTQLELLISAIEKSLPSLKESAKPVQLDQSAVGRVSTIDAIGAQAINKQAYENAKIKLENLNDSLNNINEDNFGVCIECEEPINVKRILAMPESKVCIHCARKKP